MDTSRPFRSKTPGGISTDADVILVTDTSLIWDRVESSRFLHPGYDICSYASPLTSRTGNKSFYGAPDVIFNNKKYYLPGSMCVTMAIKHNEWKVLEACSKFWCVVILNTLWQHSACRSSKISHNTVLNIQHSLSNSAWSLYINIRATGHPLYSG